MAVRHHAGQPPLDRVVQAQPAVLHELQRHRGHERLRDAADPEPRLGRIGCRGSTRAAPLASRNVVRPSPTTASAPGTPLATRESSWACSWACSCRASWVGAGCPVPSDARAGSAATPTSRTRAVTAPESTARGRARRVMAVMYSSAATMRDDEG
ncbi:MAG TPA: hypothetical protein VKP64_15510 [Mycobacteriales bacterium]|nr:hypothetical protein [Mycobacteriales bacterium]